MIYEQYENIHRETEIQKRNSVAEICNTEVKHSLQGFKGIWSKQKEESMN